MEASKHCNTLDEGGTQTRRQQAEILATLVNLYKHDKDLEAVTLEITSKEDRLITIKRKFGTSQTENVESESILKFDDSMENRTPINPVNREETDEKTKEGRQKGQEQNDTAILQEEIASLKSEWNHIQKEIEELQRRLLKLQDDNRDVFDASA